MTHNREDPLPTVQSAQAFHLRKTIGENVREARSEKREEVESAETFLHLEADIPAREQKDAAWKVASLQDGQYIEDFMTQEQAYLQRAEDDSTAQELRPICQETHSNCDTTPGSNQTSQPLGSTKFANDNVCRELKNDIRYKKQVFVSGSKVAGGHAYHHSRDGVSVAHRQL